MVGQEGRIFSLIPKERQAEAVKFLIDNAFTTPSWMIDEEILRRIEPVGVIDRIHNAQSRVLTQSAEQRALRAAGGAGDARRHICAYSPVEFLATRAQGHLEGTGCAAGEDRRLPPRVAAVLPEAGQ